MSQPAPDAYLASGQAWSDFCDSLKPLGAQLLRETAPKSALDLAEGHRYLTRMLRNAFELILEGANPDAPELTLSLSETIKSGWDNPDNLHLNARVYGEHSYRVWGTRGDAHYLSFGVYGGSFSQGGGRRTVAYRRAEELEIAADGRFELFLSPQPHLGNWIRLEPDATTLMIRQTFWNKLEEQPARLRIERLDREGPPPPLDPAFIVSALRRAARFVSGTNQLFFDMSDMWMAAPNTFFPSDPVVAAATQGIPGMYYGSGWWQCADDEAIVLDVTPPECRYWMLVLSNYWGESFEYRHRQVHINKRSARYRPDGSVRVVISHRDPQLPHANWLDREGHRGGIWTLRWLEAQQYPLPRVRVIQEKELGAL